MKRSDAELAHARLYFVLGTAFGVSMRSQSVFEYLTVRGPLPSDVELACDLDEATQCLASVLERIRSAR